MKTSFHHDTVQTISSSTTVELGGVIWALNLILQEPAGHYSHIHCDSEVAIYLTTGVYRPSANYKLVSLARALYEEARSRGTIHVYHRKAHDNNPCSKEVCEPKQEAQEAAKSV